MSKIIPNSFTAYDLSDQETLQGSIYNYEQKAVLQNLLSTYAEEKIALDYDPDNKEQFLQQEASLKSKIELLQYLLDASDAAESALAGLIIEPTD